MAKAIFHRRFDHRRKGSRYAFTALPSAAPQSFPEDVVAAAVEAGAAERVPPRRAKTAAGPDQPGGDGPARTEGD